MAVNTVPDALWKEDDEAIYFNAQQTSAVMCYKQTQIWCQVFTQKHLCLTGGPQEWFI